MARTPRPTSTGSRYPHIVVRLMPAVYQCLSVPQAATESELITYAWRIMARRHNRFRLCLCLSPSRALYLEPDGSSKWSRTPPSGGAGSS